MITAAYRPKDRAFGSRPDGKALRRPAAALAICLLSASFIATASPEQRLVFLGNSNIPPILYLENGVPEGLAVDLTRELEGHLRQPIEIRAMNWVEAQDLVAKGEADALIQINKTKERELLYDFSETLLESHFAIFMRRGRIGVSTIASLWGLKVGVEAGGLPQKLLESESGISLSVIPNFITAFRLLRDGELDAVVVDSRVGLYVLAENGIDNVVETGEPILSSQSAYAVRKGNAELLSRINAALAAMKADGSYKRVIESWRPTETVLHIRGELEQRTYRTGIVVLSFLFLILLLWMLTLRRSLSRRKTAEAKLLEQYSTLSSIINGAGAPIFALDRNYRYTCFNSVHAGVMRALYGSEVALGTSLLEAMTVEADRGMARANLDVALGGKDLVAESFSGDDLRSRRYYRVAHSPVRDETGQVLGVSVIAQDITDHRQAEEALRRQNQELRVIGACNQALLRAESEEILLQESCDIIVKEVGYCLAWVALPRKVGSVKWEPAALSVSEAHRGKIPADELSRLATPDPAFLLAPTGVDGCFLLRDLTIDPAGPPWRDFALDLGLRSFAAIAMAGEELRTLGALCLLSSERGAFNDDELGLLRELASDLGLGISFLRARDARRRSEIELERLNERFTMAVEATGLGVWDWTPLTGELHWNDQMRELLGIIGHGSTPRGAEWLALLHPGDRERVESIFAGLAEEGGAFDFECRAPMAGGGFRHLRFTGKARLDRERGAARFVGCCFDITDRIRSERELRNLNDELEGRVRQRTVELVAANRELEETINLFVGRELRMKELKARIASLEDAEARKEEDHG